MRIPTLLLMIALAGVTQLNAAGPLEGSMGYSAYRLRSTTGTSRTLDGVFLGGAWHLNPSWSLEGTVAMHAGTEAEVVQLRQWMILAGPRYTLPTMGKFRGFAHFMVGRAELDGSSGPATDQSISFVYGPGLGVDYSVNSLLSLRCQGDLSVTRYVDRTQRNLGLSLGVVIRK